MTFIVYLISLMITSAPPQVIKLEIPEVGDPCFKQTAEVYVTSLPVSPVPTVRRGGSPPGLLSCRFPS